MRFLLALTGVCASQGYAQAQERWEAASSSCATSKPIVHPGDTVELNFWPPAVEFRRPFVVTWSTNVGKISGSTSPVWKVATDLAPRDAGTALEAIAVATRNGKKIGQCVATVLAVVPASPLSEPERGLLSARSLILPGKQPETGYGLYSYLLFTRPAADEQERQRYVAAAVAFVKYIAAVEELAHYRKRSSLNVVVAPLKSAVDLSGDLSNDRYVNRVADELISSYDYPRAAALASNFGIPLTSAGPLFVAALSAAASADAVVTFDASRAYPTIVKDWIGAFCSLTSGQVTWARATLTKTALTMRNILAVSAHAAPDVTSNIEDWVRIGKALRS